MSTGIFSSHGHSSLNISSLVPSGITCINADTVLTDASQRHEQNLTTLADGKMATQLSSQVAHRDNAAL